jgi:hypothetical protein
MAGRGVMQMVASFTLCGYNEFGYLLYGVVKGSPMWKEEEKCLSTASWFFAS